MIFGPCLLPQLSEKEEEGKTMKKNAKLLIKLLRQNKKF